jgi:hypothetical protein
MRSRLWLLAGAAAFVSCSSGMRVSTTVSPAANLTGLMRFRVLTPPSRRDGRQAADDPMLVNSITNRALHEQVTQAFRLRGYVLDERNADFTVAYYASARERLDVTLWDYGYAPRWGGWGRRPGYTARPFTEGTLIVDVVDARTSELLWRGRASAEVSDEPAAFRARLREAVDRIVSRFPEAVPHVADQP